MSEKRILKLSICDKDYTVATDECDEHIYNAAKVLDNLIRSILDKANIKDEGKVAVLAALQLATNLSKQNEQHEAMKAKLNSLVSLIDNGLNSAF